LLHAKEAHAIALQYDRAAIAAGEWWRIVTCHFTHWSADHFAWNILVFAILSGACELTSRRRFVLTMCASIILIPLAMFTFQPQFLTYRGLSGLDSALFGLLAVELFVERRLIGDRRTVLAIGLLIAAFVVKTMIEVMTGTAVFADSRSAGFQPVPLAHFVGGIIGAGVALRGNWKRFLPRDEGAARVAASPL
jgi:rhomboid family GlyGly-CTERM serine protease